MALKEARKEGCGFHRQAFDLPSGNPEHFARYVLQQFVELRAKAGLRVEVTERREAEREG
jgi:hypothetical protein